MITYFDKVGNVTTKENAVTAEMRQGSRTTFIRLQKRSFVAKSFMTKFIIKHITSIIFS